MKKLFKRNQIIITALAIMIAVAGYLNYAQDNIVPGSSEVTTKSTTQAAKKAEATTKEAEPGEAVYTGVDIASYIADSKLTREQSRAKSKETLMEIVNSTSVSEEQRQQAVNKMIKLADMSDAEIEAENLLMAQGYENVVVNVSEENVNVIMDMSNVDDGKRAQIEDALKRATGYSTDKIIITPISEN